MQAYYNKMRCRAAQVRGFKITSVVHRNAEIDAEGFRKESFIVHGGWHTLLYNQFPDQKRQENVVYTVPDLWIVERYSMAEDEVKYSVIEDAVFRQNFILDDDPPKLIEGHGFERPRSVA